MGTEQSARLLQVVAGFGISTPHGILIPPGGRVAAFVRSTGLQSNDDKVLADNLVLTLAAGLARCRSGLADTVIVLPGHSESGVGTTGLANLVDGTRVIGVGRGSNMPVFRWTATTDSWALAANNCVFSGLRLRMEGANGVVLGIDITGTDNVIANCDIETASGSTAKATIPVKIDTGAHRTEIINNVFRGTPGHNSTSNITVSAAVDQCRICDNEFESSCTAASHGQIEITGAATSIKVLRNYLHNSMTSSIQCIYVADVASTGVIANNMASVENNGVAANQGVVFAATTTTKIRAFQNFCSDEPGASGILAPAVVAT